MIKTKKVPLRKCVITNERFEKKQLIRVVRTPEGNVILDLTGKANGRGAYISKNKAVLEKARKTKILDKVLEAKVEDQLYDQILEILKAE